MQADFINEIILVVIAAFIGGFVARTIKLPPVVGYLVSGIIFGIVGKSFLTSFDSIFSLSEVGVSLLLFTLGFEMSIETLRRINKKILLAGVLQVCITAVALFPLLLLFKFALPVAVLFSLIFSFSSTAVVVKILEEKGMLSNFPGNSVFIFLLIQDLFIVPVIFIMPLLFQNNFIFPETLIQLAVALIKPLGVFILIYLFGRVFLSRLLRVLFRYPSQELTILATIFIAVLSIGLLTAVGIPESIAAFLAGVLVSEEGKNLAPMSSIRPFRDILLVTFFVMMGMLVDSNLLLHNLPFVLLLTFSVLCIKFLVTFFVLRNFKFLPSANIFIASHLNNIGELAAVIGQIAFIEKYINSATYENLLAIFILSLIAIPFWIKGTKVIYTRYKSNPYVKKFMGESHYFKNSSFEEIENHVVICGHGRVGKEVRSLLEMGNVPYVVLDFDKSVVDDLVANSKNALYGDPTDTDILRAAGIEKAKILVVAVPDSFSQKVLIKTALKLNSKLVVLCRSHVDEDKYELVNLGVNTIVLPEFEAGLRIGKKVLELLGFEIKNTNSMLARLRKFHLVQ